LRPFSHRGEAGQAVFSTLATPLLSTAEDEHWYRISFNSSGKVIEYVPDEAVLKQKTLEEDNSNQYWKITGASHDTCKIENYSGGAVKGNGDDRVSSNSKCN
jgi:hypothetical protein